MRKHHHDMDWFLLILIPIHLLFVKWHQINSVETCFSRTVHLHIVLLKLSNCWLERSQTLFQWSFDIHTAHASNQLTIRYGQPFRNCFTMQTPGVLMNRNWLVQVWCSLDQNVSDTAIDRWCKRLPAYIHAKGAHFKHTMWHTHTHTLCVSQSQ